MRADENACNLRLIHQLSNQVFQSHFVHFLAQEDSYSKPLWQTLSRHWLVLAATAVNQDATDPAAFFQICLPRRFAMNQREIVSQPGDRTHRHSMRDQNHGNAALFCRQVESKSVRIAVI